MPKDVELFVRIDGELVELLCELNPEFKLDKRGVLFLKCLKALYSHIKAARLIYNDLDMTLTTKMGLVRNAYGPSIQFTTREQSMER
jgi:hypothetical protein